MTQISHDHNFKNLFQDFPKEALEWILPETLQKFGSVLHIEFIRQEPKKRRLSDRHLALDIPILFTFEQKQVILWLTEFQEDKAKFSVYKLLRYMTDMKEAYPGVIVIPTVLFTDRRKWEKDVLKELNEEFAGRVFLHFEYVMIRLFEYNAEDYFHSQNPLVRILLPKMNYKPEDRRKVIRQAYKGLYQLVPVMLFEKYADFIDIYADVSEDERDVIYRELEEHRESIMITQYIREIGKKEGIQQGVRQSVLENLEVRFASVPGTVTERINSIHNLSVLKTLLRKSILADSPEQFLQIMDECSE